MLKKATEILDVFDEMPSEKTKKYFKDKKVDDYWGAFKLYLIDTDQYDTYASACQSYQKVNDHCLEVAKDLLGQYGKYAFSDKVAPITYRVAWQLSDELKMPDTINVDIDDPSLLYDYDSNGKYHEFSTSDLKQLKKDGSLFDPR